MLGYCLMVFVSWRQLARADDVSVYCQPHLSASERLSAMSDTLWSAMYHFDAKPESLSTHIAICVLSWFHVKSRLCYSIVVPPTTLLAQATINTIPTNETAFVKVDLALDKTEVMLSHQQVQLLHIQCTCILVVSVLQVSFRHRSTSSCCKCLKV